METVVVLRVCRTEIPTINCLKKVRSHRRTVNEPVQRRVVRGLSGFWSTGPHPGYVLEGGARLPAQPSVDARTCWYKLPSSVIGEEPLAEDARVEIEHRNSLLDESFLSDDAEKPGGDVCCSKAV